MLSHHDPTYQTARLSTYANVPAGNRFGNPDTRASYNERLSVSRQPSQQPPQNQPHRQYSATGSSSSSTVNPFPTMGNGTPRRTSGMMGPPAPPMTRSIIYKSNTSLDLDHDDVVVSPSQPPDYQQLRREYGSQGSINVSGGNRFAPAPPINAGYRERIYSGPVVDIGQASPGPAAVSTLQRKSVSGHSNGGAVSTFSVAREMNKSEDSTLGSVISNGSSRGDVIHHTDTGSEASPKRSSAWPAPGSSPKTVSPIRAKSPCSRSFAGPRKAIQIQQLCRLLKRVKVPLIGRQSWMTATEEGSFCITTLEVCVRECPVLLTRLSCLNVAIRQQVHQLQALPCAMGREPNLRITKMTESMETASVMRWF